MRVLVADDHALFRDGIVSLLEAAGFDVVGQAGDGQAAVEAALRLHPDLVLLDISMPHMSGLEALRLIKRELPQTQAVMLTVSGDHADLFEAAEAGASGYLQKNLTTDQFLEMLHGVRRGEPALGQKATARLMGRFSDPSGRGSEPADCLTLREIEVLRLVAQGLSNKAIAQTLSISENTVKYHVKNILRKLGARNRTEAVTHAVRAGLLNPD